jgi:hypothetical protein
MDGHVANTEAEKFKARMRLNNLKDERDVDGLITLNWVLQIEGGRVWARSNICFRVQASSGFC